MNDELQILGTVGNQPAKIAVQRWQVVISTPKWTVACDARETRATVVPLRFTAASVFGCLVAVAGAAMALKSDWPAGGVLVTLIGALFVADRALRPLPKLILVAPQTRLELTNLTGQFLELVELLDAAQQFVATSTLPVRASSFLFQTPQQLAAFTGGANDSGHLASLARVQRSARLLALALLAVPPLFAVLLAVGVKQPDADSHHMFVGGLALFGVMFAGILKRVYRSGTRRLVAREQWSGAAPRVV